MNCLSSAKSALFLIFFLLFSNFSKAQLEEGMYLIGGSANLNSNRIINSSNKMFSFDISPVGGKVLNNNWLLGSSLNLNYAGRWSNGSFQTFFYSVGVAPFVRKYFQSKKLERLYYFPQISVGYFFRSVYSSQSNTSNSNFFNGGLGFGTSYFVAPNISIDGVLGLNFNQLLNKTDNSQSELNLGFNVGLSVFLNRNKK